MLPHNSYHNQVERTKMFVTKLRQGMMLLGDELKLEELLLPQWCWVHYQEHSKIVCITGRNEATKLMGPPLEENTDYDTAPKECEEQEESIKEIPQQVENIQAQGHMESPTKLYPKEIIPSILENHFKLQEKETYGLLDSKATISKRKIFEKDKDEIWLLKFDGSRSKKGSGAGVELTNPNGKDFLDSY